MSWHEVIGLLEDFKMNRLLCLSALRQASLDIISLVLEAQALLVGFQGDTNRHGAGVTHIAHSFQLWMDNHPHT